MSGGDTLIIKAGTYTEGVAQNAIPSGTANARTTIQSATGETVIINGTNSIGDAFSIYDRSYITIDGLIIDGHRLRIGGAGPAYSHFIRVHNTTIRNHLDGSALSQSCVTYQGPGGSSSNWWFKNVTIHDCGPTTGHGLYIGSKDSLFENITIHDTAGHCVHQYADSGLGINNNIIRKVRMYNCGQWGAGIYAGNDTQFYQNIIYDFGTVATAGGIRVGTGFSNGKADRAKIWNNTIYSGTGTCVTVTATYPTDTQVKNNLCLQNSNNIISNSGVSTIQATNVTSTDATLVLDAPSFRFTPRVGSSLLTGGTNVGLPKNGSDYVKGALDPPRNTEAEVGLIDDNELYLTWTNNVAPPLITTNACTVSLSTVSGTTLSGQNTTKHQLNTAITNGQTPTISCGTGSVTDSINIGGLYAESLAFTLFGITNNVGEAAPTNEILQTRFRFYETFNDTSGNPVPLAAENTNITVGPLASYRLRIKFKNKTADAAAFNLRARYKKNGGSATEMTTAFVDGIKAFGTAVTDTRIPIQGSPTTEILTSDESTDVAGAYVLDATSIPNVTMVTDSESEMEIAVKHDDTGSTGDTFDFELYTDQGAIVHNSATPIVRPRVTLRGFLSGF